MNSYVFLSDQAQAKRVTFAGPEPAVALLWFARHRKLFTKSRQHLSSARCLQGEPDATTSVVALAVNVGVPVAALTFEGPSTGAKAISWETERHVDQRRQWPRPCQEMFEEYARNDPDRLVDLLSSGTLTVPELSFASEAVGMVTDELLAVTALLPLLRHQAPPVREGAIYGIERHLEQSEEARAVLREIASTDSSPAVRRAAADALFLDE
jgi:hypothetical protein